MTLQMGEALAARPFMREPLAELISRVQAPVSLSFDIAMHAGDKNNEQLSQSPDKKEGLQ